MSCRTHPSTSDVPLMTIFFCLWKYKNVRRHKSFEYGWILRKKLLSTTLKKKNLIRIFTLKKNKKNKPYSNAVNYKIEERITTIRWWRNNFSLPLLVLARKILSINEFIKIRIFINTIDSSFFGAQFIKVDFTYILSSSWSSSL